MTGLTKEEVQERIEKGLVNTNEHPVTRSFKEIILKNCFTFFNFLNVALFIMVLLVGSYKNGLFVMVVVYNTIIGIVQEIHSKRILDRLAILTAAKATVLRDSKTQDIAIDQLVLDDVILLKAGRQIPADCVIISGNLEVNESLLTGESDNLEKAVGSDLYSGSFVTAGEARCRITHVGKDNYAAKITDEAKEYKKHNSELRNSLNAILKAISIIILPLGVLLFYRQYFMAGDTLRNSVVSTVAAVQGMIPEGLVLLTSIALSIGAVRLAGKRTLVQELYCIETLARVDTLCLDKTGTITSGAMQVDSVIPCPRYEDLEDVPGEIVPEMAGPEADEGMDGESAPLVGAIPPPGAAAQAGAFLSGGLQRISETFPEANELSEAELEEILGNLMGVLRDQNATANALKKRFTRRYDFQLDHVIDFSSDRKYSGAAFKDQGTYLLGASGFLFPEGRESLKKRCSSYAKQGYRVLVLCHSPLIAEGTVLPEQRSPVGIVLLSDVVRSEAPETIRYFYEQGVDLKVISGDDPATVSAIAGAAGIRDADHYVDASTLLTKGDVIKALSSCNVFGRVTPQQKREMVQALKEKGCTVAMTGDGVNDVLALKEADCSVAMASGSDAAKNIANLVLLDSDFSSMPHIVDQGRRVVNNIRTAASMFLIKTLFSVMLCVASILLGNIYPFEPVQMTLISACAVGIPTFILAQENNYNKIGHTFLRHVFMNAYPSAISITGCVVVLILVCRHMFGSTEMLSTACVLVTGWNYMAALRTVYAPLNHFRKVVIYSMQGIFFLAAVFLRNILGLRSLEFGMIILVFVLMTYSPLVTEAVSDWVKKLYAKILDREESTWYTRLFSKLMEP